ncbi:hypothetical protein [Brumimicrobium mesophilum]|uniref:hypothetical protein n=1 Tax=Brumimicrobium mesophilum TaxID=392717 RepID=UPI000D143B1C|nr:hypothetical protein [Brumimicrobium mesophilum]
MKIFYVFFLIIAISSCGTISNKTLESINYQWNKFEVNSEETIFLKLNPIDSTSTAHLFIFGGNDTLAVFGKITFTGKYKVRENGKIFLLGGIISENELKTNDGRTVKAPIDQNPMLRFNSKNRTLNYYGKEFSAKYGDRIVELEFLLKKFDNWEGEYISIHDN